jgi:predicted nucleic acid-binding protein
MTDAVFVDANVLVYERDSDQADKRARAAAWMEHLWRRRRGRLSTQVLNEFYVTVTQRLARPMAPEAARMVVRNLFTWHPVPLDRLVIEGAFSLQDRFRLSYRDALEVSAAQVAGCRYLLTEDLQDGQTFDAVQAVDPFAHLPGSLGA